MRRIPHTMTQLFWTTSEVWATVERAWGGLELRNNRFLVRGKKKKRGAVRWQEVDRPSLHLQQLEPGLPSYLWAWDSCPPSSQWWPPAAARSPPPPARTLPSAAGCCRTVSPGTRPQQSSTFGRPEGGGRHQNFRSSWVRNSWQHILTRTLETRESKLVRAQTCRGTPVCHCNDKYINRNSKNVSISDLLSELELVTLWPMMMMMMMVVNSGRHRTYPRWQRMFYVNKEFCRGEEILDWLWTGEISLLVLRFRFHHFSQMRQIA